MTDRVALWSGSSDSGFHGLFGAQAVAEAQRVGCTMTTGAMGDDEGLLTEQDAAELLQVDLSTLRRWRREGAGPPCLEIGRQVRYRRAAVQRWLTGTIPAGSPEEYR